MESQTLGKLSEALAKAQGEMEYASKDALNPHFKNKYASIASVIEAVKKPLAKHGLSYIQYVSMLEGQYCLVTKLLHTSGEWIEGHTPLLIVKQDMQGLGSAITYARRYSLAAMIGVAQDDDDGELSTQGASQVTQGSQDSQKPTPRIPPPEPLRKPSDAQLKRLYAITKDAGLTTDEVKSLLMTFYGLQSSKELNLVQYDELCKYLLDRKKVEQMAGEVGKSMPSGSWDDPNDADDSKL